MPSPFVPLFDPRLRVIDADAGSVAGARADADNKRLPLQGQSRKGRKRGHSQATIAAVRRLIEETVLPYSAIVTKTGVANGTISRWTNIFGWQRHPYAPVATDRLPTARASRDLQLRRLGNRLHLLAERCASEHWNDPAVDLDRLLQALRLLKTARREYMPHRRPRRPADEPARTGQQWAARESAIRTALTAMRRDAGTVDRIPAAAMALLDEATPRRRTNSPHP